MITRTTPLSMAESLKYVKSDELKAFINSFTHLDYKKAEELRQKLVDLDIIKLNDKFVTKLIDTLPETKEEILKISTSVNLDQNEIEKILQTIKEYK